MQGSWNDFLGEEDTYLYGQLVFRMQIDLRVLFIPLSL